ncbi:MAG: tRNA threonylcarbamoyladenosine dehydratase, partial [Clostridiales bacterium]|nr:tRNA threonylcarbamoyladenosine dehydratase [Clostridiales bacterium]
VCIFGIGGVGSFALETIVRAGVGHVIIADYAVVDETNINRQLIALKSTVGIMKTQVAVARMKDINPDISITAFDDFVNSENIFKIIPPNTDYIIDAIDSVSSKLDLIEYASENNIPIICCMGTGNKLHPEKLRISDIFKTSVDPLARVMRSELKKRGIKKLKVVWSDEIPAISGGQLPVNKDGKKVPASISFVPSVAGLLLSSEVVNHLADIK